MMSTLMRLVLLKFEGNTFIEQLTKLEFHLSERA